MYGNAQTVFTVTGYTDDSPVGTAKQIPNSRFRSTFAFDPPQPKRSKGKNMFTMRNTWHKALVAIAAA